MLKDSIKCVVVGDGNVGKTCLLHRYAKDDFPEGYVATIFDNYQVTVPIGDESIQLILFDTAGQEIFDELRKAAFHNTDIVLICFAVDHLPSFQNVRELWIPELKENCTGVPFILVGTKIDTRDDRAIIEKLNAQGLSPVSKEKGTIVARELGAVTYMECSALTKENVDDVFKEAILTALSDDHDSPKLYPKLPPIINQYGKDDVAKSTVVIHTKQSHKTSEPSCIASFCPCCSGFCKENCSLM